MKTLDAENESGCNTARNQELNRCLFSDQIDSKFDDVTPIDSYHDPLTGRNSEKSKN